MKITAKKQAPSVVKTPALVFFLFEDDPADLKNRPELADFSGQISPRLSGADFKAKHLNTLTLFQSPDLPAERIILVGLGKTADYSQARLRQAAIKAVQAAASMKLSAAAVVLPPLGGKVDQPEEMLEAVALGAALGDYRFSEFKTRDQEDIISLKTLTLIAHEKFSPAKAREALQRAEATAKAVTFARDVINRPANVIHPESLAAAAKELAAKHGVKTKVLGPEDARKRNMGAFLGVAQGSERTGRIIILEYRGAQAKTPAIALIGKAVTFDSGGISIKPSEHMGAMKADMSGGAAVIAAVCAAAEMGLKVNLIGVVPAVENMPDGKAYRPGDILTSMSGQTIEIISTDAEGRLILADALTLVQEEYKPACMIDLATLTGACVVALGEKCAGMMGNNDDLINEIKAAGDITGERVWPMPLFDDYFEVMKSDAADFKNAGVRWGGAITAALFIKQFVQNDTPWVHLDIAGPAFTDKATPDSTPGGVGFGVNLLLRFLRSREE